MLENVTSTISPLSQEISETRIYGLEWSQEGATETEKKQMNSLGGGQTLKDWKVNEIELIRKYHVTNKQYSEVYIKKGCSNKKEGI